MKIMDFIVTFILLITSGIAKLISNNNRRRLGSFAGYILLKMSNKRLAIARANLKVAFPNHSLERIDKIAKESYRSLGITLVETLFMHNINKTNVDDYIKFENTELIRNLHSLGRGIIFISGHLGNWELMAYSTPLILDIPVTVVVKEQNNKIANSLLKKRRSITGNKMISMGNAARGLISELRAGKAIALLTDQSVYKGLGARVNFFGVETDTFDAPARLALKLKTPIVIGFPLRQIDGKYKVEAKQVEYNDLNNDDAGVLQLTQRLSDILEETIIRFPEQWAWQHKRWKNTNLKYIYEK